MDVGVVIAGVLGIMAGAWVVLRRDAFAKSGARWQNRVYGINREVSEYTTWTVVVGVLVMAVGVVITVVGLS